MEEGVFITWMFDFLVWLLFHPMTLPCCDINIHLYRNCIKYYLLSHLPTLKCESYQLEKYRRPSYPSQINIGHQFPFALAPPMFGTLVILLHPLLSVLSFCRWFFKNNGWICCKTDHKHLRLYKITRLKCNFLLLFVFCEWLVHLVICKMKCLVFESNGILYQTSSSHTSHQSGLNECKHQHLLNVHRSWWLKWIFLCIFGLIMPFMLAI